MTILYHRPSGITHVLLPPAPDILVALDAGPADVARIAARLGLEDEADGEAMAVIAARLAELAGSGLVAIEG